MPKQPNITAPDRLVLERGKALAKRAHVMIPGGCHTYAKGDDQYPELAPSFIARGKGCRHLGP